MAEEDIQKTAFAAPSGGLYEYTTMPFGLCNAPGTFERLMERVLNKLQWSIAVLYLDDIIVFGRTWEEHMRNLELVLQRISMAGLKLKPKKCQLCQKRVKFLGHIVSSDGIEVNPAKVEAVQNMPEPQNTTDVRAFLGLASYYRKFIKDFSVIAKPLTRLTKKEETKNQVFVFDTEALAAFEKLKVALTTTPVLAYPDVLGGEFILDTDASGFAMGAVLSQVQNGQERVIAYGSRTFSEEQTRYCTTRRELLAVVTFILHFKPYLRGRKFLLRTDHGPLRWLHTTKKITGQSYRWTIFLHEYDFVIEHRAGIRHGNADGMSRLALPHTTCADCDIDYETYEGPSLVDLDALKALAKLRDEELERERVENRQKLSKDKVAKVECLKRICTVYYTVNDDVDDSDWGYTEPEGDDVELEEVIRPKKKKKKPGKKTNRPEHDKPKDAPEPTDWTVDFIGQKQREDTAMNWIIAYLRIYEGK
jgi:hypothetical protein